MWIGVAKIYLDYFNNNDVSKKHRMLRDLCDDIRKIFNISAMEIDSFEDPEKCVIGIATIIPEIKNEKKAKEQIQAICKFIDETASARVVAEDWDLLSH